MHPTDQPAAAPARASSSGVGDVVALLQGVPLTTEEAAYVEAARAPNTLRGYRFDWAHRLSTRAGALEPRPAKITGYLTALAGRGAKGAR